MLHYLIHSYCVVGTPNSEFGNPFAFRDFSWDVQVGTLSCCKPSDGISENTVARPVEQSYMYDYYNTAPAPSDVIKSQNV